MVEQKTNRKDTFVDSESTVDNHNIENVEDETMNGKWELVLKWEIILSASVFMLFTNFLS